MAADFGRDDPGSRFRLALCRFPAWPTAIPGYLERASIKSSAVNAASAGLSSRPTGCWTTFPQRKGQGQQTKGRIATANDPDARWGKKGSQQWTGYKTAVFQDGEREVITDIDVCPGNRPDSETVPPHFDRAPQEKQPADMVADGAYGYPQLRQMLKEKGMVPTDNQMPSWSTPGGGLVALKEDHAIRAKVERKQAELVKYHGLRVTHYIGLAKVKLQAYFTAAAVNIKRLGLLGVNAACA